MSLLTKLVIGVRRESAALLPLWKTGYRQQMELCRYPCRCLPWNVHNLYSSPSCRIWWFIPPVAIVLAYSDCVRRPSPCMGLTPGGYTAQIG